MGKSITSKHVLTCTPDELTAGVISEFLDPVPADTRVDVKVSYADRQGEHSTVTMSADVDISKGRIY